MQLRSTPVAPTLGVQANWRQFSLLVLVNAFVGAMVGLERTILADIPGKEFGLTGARVALSFIVVFGLVKAATNFFAGALSDHIGRKRVLVLGWLFGLPVPLLVIWAPTWEWILFANVLLGINQGLAWSTTVIMKIDLVGPSQRGLAVGLNEAAGYLALSLSAVLASFLAERFGLRPEPFYLGVGFAAVALLLTALLVRDTSSIALLEAWRHNEEVPAGKPALSQIFRLTSWENPALSSCTQAGLVNNLNDGLSWGLFPLFFATAGLSLGEKGLVVGIYPATWGVCQLVTGILSDRWGRKPMIVWGMVIQGAALVSIALTRGLWPWAVAQVFLGIGTAMVYPTLLAVIGDLAHPTWRASAVGVYRLWRDGGTAAGAVIAGFLADYYSMPLAIAAVGILTSLSGLLTAWRMPETHPRR